MATNIIVNPTELESAAGIIDGLNNDLTNKLYEFKAKVTGLSEVWDSTTSRKTMDAIASLEKHFAEYHDVIDDYKNQMIKIAEEYSSREAAIAANAENVEYFM